MVGSKCEYHPGKYLVGFESSYKRQWDLSGCLSGIPAGGENTHKTL